MRLPKPFFRLPRRFDVARLRAEVEAIPEAAWVAHPNGIPGNSSVRLISAEGGENDRVEGQMRPTPHLEHALYIRQLLASFEVPWSRTRLLRLAPGADVPQHADINYHWFYRVRLHVPVITRPEVRFTCDGSVVHMAPGEAWVFDNWRLHSVSNPTSEARIHLVADTAGSAAFWQLVGAEETGTPSTTLRYEPGRSPLLLTERDGLRPVMNPAEVELLVGNLRAELLPAGSTPQCGAQLMRYHALLDAFVRDWRKFYSQHGEEPAGWDAFAQLRDATREASRMLGEGIAVRTNRVPGHKVLEGRVLRVVLPQVAEAPTGAARSTAGAFRNPALRAAAPAGTVTAAAAPPRRPVFIVGAPRSGSTLLYETLAVSHHFHTLGGEAHWLVEDIPALRPGAPGVDSNRLTAAQATVAHADEIYGALARESRNVRGNALGAEVGTRLLEKTPKNALRVPFLAQLFADASFIFLWRDPRENIASIVEAWRSGKWKTYNGLPGFTGPWSLLLPPGWQQLEGQPLETVAAFQWESTNRLLLDDLANLPAARWTSLYYTDLVSATGPEVTRLCEFLGLNVDAALAQRLNAPLPHSRFTLTPPRAEKWRVQGAAIERVLPTVEATWRRLAALRQGYSPKRKA